MIVPLTYISDIIAKVQKLASSGQLELATYKGNNNKQK
jgi:hypothetical protein